MTEESSNLESKVIVKPVNTLMEVICQMKKTGQETAYVVNDSNVLKGYLTAIDMYVNRHAH